ncbi:hydroxysqualene dehydroxylase HpnE [Parachitinimonas caeni]|uniref:Hydroxysqualene dehydroxylase HpnE n=1 Tax=Parachitinimonas caeni TaxID=3031301 RepID=A0ABT7DVA0_9NEIS|nr:hydroxysqualene dehydroxylase HpnE [Parachitinimonas caeni]MDK2123914.1 hydroxysqualene dehydroxylase HpnE [Parachitinimonas caeni]
MKPTQTSRVAIIGGGYAGMAAAVELAAAGRQVAVFEAGKVLGGRARRLDVDGLVLDNGQHLVVGAYRELLRLMTQVGIDEASAFLRQPLDLSLHGQFSLRCPRLPAPLHVAAALLFARGLSLSERWQIVRAMEAAKRSGYRLQQDCSVAQWVTDTGQSPQVLQRMWEPLTLAALNTPVNVASAQVLLNVLRDSLGASRAASDFLLPRLDLSTTFPDAAARYIEQRGGQVRLGVMARHLQRLDDGWQFEGSDGQTFDTLICALPPHRASMLLGALPPLSGLCAQLDNWHYQPIYTVYLRYPPQCRLPKPIQGMLGGYVQWLFDRSDTHGQPGVLAAVISADGPHAQLGRDALAKAVAAEIRAAFPGFAAPLWHQVIAEKRATFACTPGLQRPANATGLPGLWLAGDYTAGDYPATLEGAVRSGVQAAGLILQSLQ